MGILINISIYFRSSMTCRAPKNLIKNHFKEFMEVCKKSIKDGRCRPKNDIFMRGMSESIFKKQKNVLEYYQNWMKSDWVQELVMSTLCAFDDFSKAEPYTLAWCSKNTFTLYKLLSLHGSEKKDTYVLKYFSDATLVALIWLFNDDWI